MSRASISLLVIAIGCGNNASSSESRGAPDPERTPEQAPSEPSEEAEPSYATGHSCLGIAGEECPAGELCVRQPGSSGGRCESRPRGQRCGTTTCTSEEMCCNELCIRPAARVTCTPGLTERGMVGTRCGPDTPCQQGWPCVTPADRGEGDEDVAGHCTVTRGEGAPCDDSACLPGLSCTEVGDGASRCLPPRTDGPCQSDDDCMAHTDCDCSCAPRLRSIPLPEGEAWMTMCDGGPPPPCGVQSPCAERRVRCDSSSHRCVVVPSAP